MQTYDIIRFTESGTRRLIHRGITKEQAREWCNDDLTSSRTNPELKRSKKAPECFDGFSETNTYLPKATPKYKKYHSPTSEYL